MTWVGGAGVGFGDRLSLRRGRWRRCSWFLVIGLFVSFVAGTVASLKTRRGDPNVTEGRTSFRLSLIVDAQPTFRIVRCAVVGVRMIRYDRHSLDDFVLPWPANAH